MKKYVITRTGETVNIGDTIRKTKKIENSFGTIETIEDVLVTKSNIDSLVKAGVLKCIDTSLNTSKNKRLTLEIIIESLAKKYNKSVEEIIDWMNTTNKFCPRVVLDLLLHEAAYCLNGRNSNFMVENTYYTIDSDNGLTRHIPYSRILPLFKTEEDLELVRKVLKAQFKLMYGE